MACQGTPDDHCCWIGGEVCFFFDPASDAEKHCSLRAELGSWDAVHMDSRYLTQVKIIPSLAVYDCGDWPGPGNTCATCGVTQDG